MYSQLPSISVGRSSICNQTTPHAVLTGTHLWWSEQSLACIKINQHDLYFGNDVTRFPWSWRLGRLPLRRSTLRFWIISVNPCLVTGVDAYREFLIRFCLSKEISGDRQVVFLLVDGEDTRNEYRRNTSHVQILCQNGWARNARCASLCRNFTHYPSQFARINSRTRVTKPSFLLADGRRKHILTFKSLRTVFPKFNAKLDAHTLFLLFPTFWERPKMRRGTGTPARSTKAGEALPNGFEPSFVPWSEETQAHVPAKRRVPTPHPSRVRTSLGTY
jgi:hypothetical protein